MSIEQRFWATARKAELAAFVKYYYHAFSNQHWYAEIIAGLDRGSWGATRQHAMRRALAEYERTNPSERRQGRRWRTTWQRLKPSESSRLSIQEYEMPKTCKHCGTALAELAAVKAENDRLRKAGAILHAIAMGSGVIPADREAAFQEWKALAAK